MTDLITRLLADADAWDPPDAPGAAPHDGPEVACLEREGAAEIKRLRAALEDIASRESEARDIVKQNRWPSTLAIDMAGMAAMTLANAYTGDTSGNAFFRLRAEIDHLRAEVERLRAALGELHALAWGECPSILNEDSGGDARLDTEIRALLVGATGTPPVREKRAYYETHDAPHCPTCECGRAAKSNSADSDPL